MRLSGAARSSGVITTVAGTPQSTGLAAGDGGPATEAILFRPFWVAFDEADQLYVSSHLGNTVRRVDSAGIITTIVGTGARGYSGDGGPATQATLKNPLGILVDGPWLYVADSYNDVIRRVELSTGTITSWAGRTGWSAEGLSAGVAAFNYPHSVVADAAGNAYVADTYDNTVRRISATTSPPWLGTGSPTGAPAPARSRVTEDQRPRRGCTSRPPWPSTTKVTCTSPIAPTTASDASTWPPA